MCHDPQRPAPPAGGPGPQGAGKALPQPPDPGLGGGAGKGAPAPSPAFARGLAGWGILARGMAWWAPAQTPFDARPSPPATPWHTRPDPFLHPNDPPVTRTLTSQLISLAAPWEENSPLFSYVNEVLGHKAGAPAPPPRPFCSPVSLVPNRGGLLLLGRRRDNHGTRRA